MNYLITYELTFLSVNYIVIFDYFHQLLGMIYIVGFGNCLGNHSIW